MTPDQFSQAIKTRLHPEPYGREVIPCGEFDFLIMCSSAMPGGRYAFAFRQLGSQTIADVYRQARSEARRLTGSMWCFREVGLYMMLCGSQALWRDHEGDCPADKTGLHSIIVQAVHFVDPETGANHLNQSSWGSVKFGGLIPIPEMIKEVIERIPNN